MVTLKATIEKFNKQGEKTGWTYVIIPEAVALQLKPGNKKSFRIKGTIDNYAIKGVAVMPMGDGSFILALNAAMRKDIKKLKGATVQLKITADTDEVPVPEELLLCLEDEPKAKAFFNNGLLKSHRNYYIRWSEGVKGEAAKAKRIAAIIEGLARGYDFGQFMQWQKGLKG